MLKPTYALSHLYKFSRLTSPEVKEHKLNSTCVMIAV